MSETLIASLQARITELTEKNATLMSEAKNRRLKSNDLQTKLDAALKELGTITTERDDLKTKAEAGPKELTDKIASLEGELRTRDHKSAFSSVKEFKVKGEDGKETAYTLNDGVTVDAVWKHLEYKPEGDQPDEAKITGLLSGAVNSAKYLFKPKAADAATTEADASKQPNQFARREPGPGSGTRVTTPATSERPSTASVVQADYAKSGRTIPGKL